MTEFNIDLDLLVFIINLDINFCRPLMEGICKDGEKV